MIEWKQNFVSSILVFKQIGLPSTQSSDFVYHLNDYTLNWTPLSPITIWLFMVIIIVVVVVFFFQRLNTANEEIIEVLLSKQQVSLASFMINFFQIIAFDVFLFLTWPFHFVSFLLHNSFPLCSFYLLYVTFEPLVPRTLPHQGSS